MKNYKLDYRYFSLHSGYLYELSELKENSKRDGEELDVDSDDFSKDFHGDLFWVHGGDYENNPGEFFQVGKEPDDFIKYVELQDAAGATLRTFLAFKRVGFKD